MKKRNVHFAAVGDITLGDHPVCFGHGVRSKIDQYGFDFLFQDIVNEFENQDIVFGNLETVLSAKHDDAMLISSQEFRGKTEYASNLAKVGFNVLSVANNHAMQYGKESFHKTRDSLTTSGISPIGISNTGLSNVFYFKSAGVSVAMVAYSMRPEQYSNDRVLYMIGAMDSMIHQVRSLKSDKHIVIVSLHWGEEFIPYPSSKQVQDAHKLIDAGASLIIGHHPHVIQGIEKYKHGVIAYSLGNFIADFWQLYTRKTLILKCEISSNGIENIDYIPILINDLFQPQPVRIENKDLARKEIDDLKNMIPFEIRPDHDNLKNKYQQVANDAYFKYRKECYTYFLRNIFRYSFSTLKFSLARFITRRLDTEK